MSCLLYCIFRAAARQGLEIPPGAGGRPVCVVGKDGLGVALSELAASEASPEIEDILAYAKVVEALYRRQTVIPFGYGYLVESPSEAAALLDNHRVRYEKLLAELDGLDEMGIRVLLPSTESASDKDSRRRPPKTFTPPCNSGAGYLAAQRQRYLGLDRQALHRRLVVDEVCDSLSGLFVRRKVEWHGFARNQFFSIYFLVSRPLLNPFREGVGRLPSKGSAKLLLSGPWPPYNFVDSRQE